MDGHQSIVQWWQLLILPYNFSKLSNNWFIVENRGKNHPPRHILVIFSLCFALYKTFWSLYINSIVFKIKFEKICIQPYLYFCLWLISSIFPSFRQKLLWFGVSPGSDSLTDNCNWYYFNIHVLPQLEPLRSLFYILSLRILSYYSWKAFNVVDKMFIIATITGLLLNGPLHCISSME